MKIVVTGGAGFIGRHLVAQLSRLNHGPVLVVDNLHRGLSGPFPPCVEFQKFDIRDRSALTDAMKGSDVVFHLAAQAAVMVAISNADYTFGANVAGTYNVLEAARDSGVSRVIFTSSREVYGQPENLPVRETAPLRPKNNYGASKAAGEAFCHAAQRNLETVVLRLSNVYGPGDRDRVIPHFAELALAGKPLPVYGGDKVLDLVWIGTVVDALIRAAFGPWIREPINVASGTAVSVAELARRVVHLTGSDSPVHVVPEREQEVGRFVADITRAEELLELVQPQDPLWRLPDTLDRSAFISKPG